MQRVEAGAKILSMMTVYARALHPTQVREPQESPQGLTISQARSGGRQARPP